MYTRKASGHPAILRSPPAFSIDRQHQNITHDFFVRLDVLPELRPIGIHHVSRHLADWFSSTSSRVAKTIDLITGFATLHARVNGFTRRFRCEQSRSHRLIVLKFDDQFVQRSSSQQSAFSASRGNEDQCSSTLRSRHGWARSASLPSAHGAPGSRSETSVPIHTACWKAGRRPPPMAGITHPCCSIRPTTPNRACYWLGLSAARN